MYLLDRLIIQSRVPGKKQDGLTALALNTMLLQFAAGMVGMFGVLFIFQLADSLALGLLYILIFFGVQRLFVAFFVSFIGELVSKIGYRWVMFMGIIALAFKLFFFTLVTPTRLWPLFPALILGGFMIAAYYLGYHGVFLDDNDDARIGEQIGFITMIGNFAQVASPLAAGVLIDTFGFSAMFIVSMILLLFSTVPLMTMQKHRRHQGAFSPKGILNFINTRKKLSYSMVVWYITAGIQVFFWPIYLYKVVGTYTIFGVVGSIAMVANSIALYLIGRAYDNRAHRKVFWGSTALVSATWVTRFLSITPVTAAVSDILNRLFSPFWWMKIRRKELLEGERADSLVFGAAHELLVTSGYIVALLMGFFILKLSGGVWPWLIIPTVLGTFVASVLIKDV